MSLLQSIAMLLTPNIADFHLSGGPVPPLNAPAGTYRTSDGWIAVSLVKEQNFNQLCDVVGLPDLPGDPRFGSFQSRAEHLPALIDLLQDRFKTATTAEWAERCSSGGDSREPRE